MENKTEVIDLANDKKFSEFSKAVKQTLDDKLRNHPTIVAKAAELETFQKAKETFAQISEPVEETPVETEVETPVEETPTETEKPATTED